MAGERSTSIVAAAALIGVLAALVAADRAVATPRASSCPPDDVVVWLQGSGDAAAGSSYYTLALTNLSGHACTLRGYPGVSAVDLAARQVGSAAGRNPRSPARTIRVAAGDSARVLLQVAHTGVFPAAACRPVTAAGLRVYLPGATSSSVVPIPLRACSKQGPVYLHVTAVTS